MIDPFDAALSDFIDSLPEEHVSAKQLLDEAAPFSGHGDLPELAEIATMLRAVPPYEARPEWMAATKARLMAAPVLPPEKRGLTWLGTMFLPLTQISFPSLPKLTITSPVLARAVVAMALIVTLGSMAVSGSMGRSPLLQVTAEQGPVVEAQQAILAIEQQLSLPSAGSSTRDIVLLSKQLELADDAIDQAPAAAQPRLRAQLQATVRAVRFDGTLEAILNASTIQVDGVAVQADPASVRELHVGQHISVQVTVSSQGKLLAVAVSPAPATTDVNSNAGSTQSGTRGGGVTSGSTGSSLGQTSTSTSSTTSGTTQSTVVATTVDDATSAKVKDSEKSKDVNSGVGSKGKSQTESTGVGSTGTSTAGLNESGSSKDKDSSTTPGNSSASSGQPAPTSTSSGNGQGQAPSHPLAMRDVTASQSPAGANQGSANSSSPSTSSGSSSSGNSGKSSSGSASTSSGPASNANSSSSSTSSHGKSDSKGDSGKSNVAANSNGSSSKGDNSDKKK